MSKPSDIAPQDRWAEAEQSVNAAPPAGWDALTVPLDGRTRDALIERALALRSRAEPRRRGLVVSLGLSLAAAAVVLLMLRPEDPMGPIELDLRIGRAEVRGAPARSDPEPVLSLRNEPMWTVRLTEPDPGHRLALYLVAERPDGSLTLLNASIERRDAAFRLTGELGDLGLRPGEWTMHFVVGPRDSGAEAVERVRAYIAGEPPSGAWRAEARRVRLTE